MSRENLLRLASYLETLPEDYEHFDMGLYACTEESDEPLPSELDLTECGTVACAVGHGPAAGIAPEPDEDWSEYSERVFDLPFTANPNSEWAWCFDSEWAAVDNTPTGAAKRIRYLLEHGKAPPHFDRYKIDTFHV